mgnify:CR=1 FL=1
MRTRINRDDARRLFAIYKSAGSFRRTMTYLCEHGVVKSAT